MQTLALINRTISTLKKYAHLRIQIPVLAALVLMASCTRQAYTTSVQPDNSYHSSYDDTTLSPDNSSILMPYNRFVDPAGKLVRFGRSSEENHSLDCVLLPGEKVLAVEDRFGLTFIDVVSLKLLDHLDYGDYKEYQGVMSTYSGVKVWQAADQQVHIFWGAAHPSSKKSYVLDAVWDGKKATLNGSISFTASAPASLALPNDVAVREEDGVPYLYTVLNGNNELVKIRITDNKIIWSVKTGMAPFGLVLVNEKAYVTNWAGSVPTNGALETAGIPYGSAYTDPRTGATSTGTVSVFDTRTGSFEKEIPTGLHPNAIIASKDHQYVFVANGNSDYVSVIATGNNKVVDSIDVGLKSEAGSFIGHSPNALAIDNAGSRLYVANGMDNAVAVVQLGAHSSGWVSGLSVVKGYIPTEAYPAGLALTSSSLFVANLEGEGARTTSKKGFTPHQQQATVSVIPLPGETALQSYTRRVENANLLFRTRLSQLAPRAGIAPRPVPERIGEPSVFKHIVYIIKENKTYDQVLGDLPQGNGNPSLCIYGDSITPNEHKLAREFLLLDNYYVSGKSSAEGHSWTDAAIVTDYVEKNVRAWFRSYPHVLADAMVYNKQGFLWNNALDHGKTVRVYGEACEPKWDRSLGWKDIYQLRVEGKPFDFTNQTTISRLRPVLSTSYPCYDGQNINDQLRADAFINDLKQYQNLPGDQLPQLMILALPADHTAGMREGFPTPRAMVADNDLALGRILEALTHSRFWDSTAVFVTEDDSQSGWDHVSAYRTVGFVISPYSRLQRTVHTNYNQTCLVRTIEQILGIPPMNIMDATALPLFNCFENSPKNEAYISLKNNIPLNEMNKPSNALKGRARKFSILSASPEFAHVDGGNDDLLNRILWYAAKANQPYPKNMLLPRKLRKDDDD